MLYVCVRFGCVIDALRLHFFDKLLDFNDGEASVIESDEELV